MSLEALLDRPLAPPDPETLAAATAGEADPEGLLGLGEMDRLLDARPLAVETGWWRLPDGTQQVAVRTPMPGVTAEMIEWWFDWHAREPIRYRIWHPAAHESNAMDVPATPGAKAHWGAVHHPVEDVGTGMERIRIAFVRPTAFGFSRDEIDGTIVCGFIGDERRRAWHSLMAHVWLRDGDGLVLRSRFWLGARLRPMLPAPLSAPLGRVMNRRFVRRQVMPDGLAPALARHCCEEYANLAAFLPELYQGV
ncbi:MAG: hypothetical protein JHC95_00065 [Solirubrobacteraceae bacterium]|nr:hypothetical protein [Solirubrobacteraceae bacterium]